MTVRPEELTATLVRRARAAFEADARQAKEIRTALDEMVAEELRAGSIRRAWLIGSLAWGTFGVRSDVDLVVEGLSLPGQGPLWGRLVDRLRVEVDLLRIEELPDPFRKRVFDEGVEIVP